MAKPLATGRGIARRGTVVCLVAALVLPAVGCSKDSSSRNATSAGLSTATAVSDASKASPSARLSPTTLLSKVPHFSLDTIKGGHVDFPGDFRGASVLVTFWASWCPACDTEALVLADAYKRWQDSGIRFLGIDLSDELKKARTFARRHTVGYDSVFDGNGRMYEPFGLKGKGFPASFLVAADGSIVAVKLGPFKTPDEIDSYLSRLAPGFAPLAPQASASRPF